MSTIFLIIVVVLILLAISDLVVGVSNDAVNFLNGAVGSKAATLRVILIVAAAGIIAGATFSNGMMEVARKGLFSPASFAFKDVMIIFLAVMLTDVILLDLFNTFGLPTSTTVSMVFELLGAAVGVAIIKISHTTGDFTEMVNYINSGKALAIISGILISVVIAFSFGAIMQWLSRLLFTFSYEKNLKYFGGLFGGFAITCILYFILIKGLKDSIYASHVVSSIPLHDWLDFLSKQDFDGFKSLVKTLQGFKDNSVIAAWGTSLASMDKDTYKTGMNEFIGWARINLDQNLSIPLYLIQWVNYYSWQILLFAFVGCSLLLQAFYWLFRLNILKVIVLLGTFALAMAFAGNDLVNFIGVPLAGLASYQEFMGNPGADPDQFLMVGLLKPVSSPPMLLLIAGLIMVITLWLSKKARSVIKTSLDLGDQDQVNERFSSNALSRTIVRESLRFGSFFGSIFPESFKKKISKRFDPSSFTKKAKKEKGLSFDLLRGAVTLVVSSALIAFGTSLKLPLSTTYVTFMVAMGASLADGAWDRESAVYRITGVITVIGGWFFTAFSAFTVALLIGVFIYFTWFWGVFVMASVAIFLVLRAHFAHKKRVQKEEKAEKLEQISSSENIYDVCSQNMVALLVASSKSYSGLINGLCNEKRKKLKDVANSVSELNSEAKKLKKRIPDVFKLINEEALEGGHYYAEIVDYFREAMHNLNFMTNPAYTHVDNNHKPLTNFQAESLLVSSTEIQNYISRIVKNITESNFKHSGLIQDECTSIVEKLIKIRNKQLKLIKKEPGSTRTNVLFLDILNESKNFVLNLNNMHKSFRDFAEYSYSYSKKTFI